MSATTRRASSYADPDAYLSARVRDGGSRKDRYFVVKDVPTFSGHADDGFVPAAVALAARNGDFSWLSGAPDAKDRYADAESEADEPAASAEKKRPPADTREASESSEPETSETATETETETDEETDKPVANADDARPPRMPAAPWESHVAPPPVLVPAVLRVRPASVRVSAPSRRTVEKKRARGGRREEKSRRGRLICVSA